MYKFTYFNMDISINIFRKIVMSFINKTNILIKKNNNDLYYFDLDQDIVFTKISNKTNTLISKNDLRETILL